MHILDVITYTYGLKPFGIEKILQFYDIIKQMKWESWKLSTEITMLVLFGTFHGLILHYENFNWKKQKITQNNECVF